VAVVAVALTLPRERTPQTEVVPVEVTPDKQVNVFNHLFGQEAAEHSQQEVPEEPVLVNSVW
jgi:hypothetical protein